VKPKLPFTITIIYDINSKDKEVRVCTYSNYRSGIVSGLESYTKEFIQKETKDIQKETPTVELEGGGERSAYLPLLCCCAPHRVQSSAELRRGVCETSSFKSSST
jgi:hypothetical protein